MSANRNHYLIIFLILVLLIITMSCYSVDQAYDNWQPKAATKAGQNTAPQVVPTPVPDPQSAQEEPGSAAEADDDNQPSDQAAEQEPIQQPDPQPDPEADPEHEQTELEKCVANKDVVLINGDVTIEEKNDEETGTLISRTCRYDTRLVSEASQPIVILYQWNQFDDEFDIDSYHWRFDGPIQPGGQKDFQPYLYSYASDSYNTLLYDRLVSYVTIYDTPECKKYINSLDLMRQTRSVFFDCDQYIPKE